MNIIILHIINQITSRHIKLKKKIHELIFNHQASVLFGSPDFYILPFNI
jgi:membrane-bound acyltransferase YfiQ involved in biofilm formation